MLRDTTETYLAFRKRLSMKKPVFGMALTGPGTAFAEIVAHAGFDFAWIDMEHTTLSLAEVEHLIITLENRECIPLVRVRRNEPNCIGQTLDMGALIVNIHHVDTVEDAGKAVYGAKYYPVGRRGYSTFNRSTSQGSDRLNIAYMSRKNDETMLMVQIESEEAVNNANEIAAVDGVDALFVGYADLCQDMGIDPDPNHPRCKEAIREVGEALKKTGKFGAFITGNPDEMDYYHDLGYDIICCGLDTRTMKTAVEGIYEKFKPYY